MRTTWPAALYNVGPYGENGRRFPALAAEMHGFAAAGILIVAAVETTWPRLPQLPDYKRFRDTSRPGRANVTVWVHRDLTCPTKAARWHDLSVAWARTERPGVHPPRSWLELSIDGGQWIFGHQPPRGIKDPRPPHDWITDKAQLEGINLLVRRMAPWKLDDWSDRSPADKKAARARLRVVLMDPNRDPQAPRTEPGPNQLAHRIDGPPPVGTNIEGAVGRRLDFIRPRKVASIGGRRLGSDHHGAFITTVKEIS